MQYTIDRLEEEIAVLQNEIGHSPFCGSQRSITVFDRK